MCNEYYLDKGGKSASATSNLQHLGVVPFGVPARGSGLHEPMQGNQALPLHGVLPSKKQGLCRRLIDAC